MKKHYPLIALIVTIVCMLVIVFLAITNYPANGIVFVLCLTAVTGVAYLVHKEFTV